MADEIETVPGDAPVDAVPPTASPAVAVDPLAPPKPPKPKIVKQMEGLLKKAQAAAVAADERAAAIAAQLLEAEVKRADAEAARVAMETSLQNALTFVTTAEKAASNLFQLLEGVEAAKRPQPPVPGASSLASLIPGETIAPAVVVERKPPQWKNLGFDMHASEVRKLENAKVLLHVGDGAGAEFHVDLWMPYIYAAGVDAVAAIRSQVVYKNLASRADLDLVYIKEGRNAEALVQSMPNLRAILYVSNTGNVVHFLRFNHIRHIFVGHGDSEKAASCHKGFRQYDEVWTAGQAHIDRFKNSGINFKNLEFSIVGRPGLEGAGEAREPAGTFLYMPTWEGFQSEQNYSSIAMGADFVRLASYMSGKLPILKFHPWTGNQNKDFAQAENLYRQTFTENQQPAEFVPRSVPAPEVMARSDFMIGDISSVVSDYLPRQKPIFLFRPEDINIRMSQSNMQFDDYCYVFSDLEQLTGLIQSVIVDGNDILKDARRRALNYFVNVDATKSRVFAREVQRVANLTIEEAL